MFNFDTPWHPDDYVHRIGRTGRAGAKGRAFTFVAPEDAEAIANVEKLTEMKIPVFEMGGGSKGERPEKAEKAEPSERRPRREERGEDAPPKVREESPRKSDRKRAEKAPAKKPKEPRREDPVEDDDDDGEWNGPVPGFLGQSIG